MDSFLFLAEAAATDADKSAALFMLVVYVLIALGVSTLCSLFESVLLSITPAYIARLKQEESPSYERLQALKAEVDKPLATILTLNTIAHTIGAAGAGAEASVAFGAEYLGAVSAVLTVLILIVSEIIPKSLGAAYWRKLAPSVGAMLAFLSKVLGPIVWIELQMTKLFTTKSAHGASDVSREEITAIAHLGADQGVFEEGESRILRNMFRFGSLQARDVMTPRTVLYALPEETPVSELADRETIRFSRIPLYRGSIDKITGYVFVNEILLAANHGGRDKPLKDYNREIKLIAQEARLSKVFDTLLGAKSPVALVVDEFGGTAGLVTLEDLVETLLGMEIVDEVDAVQDMQELARKQWRRRAVRLGLIEDEGQDPLASQIVTKKDDEPAGEGEAAADEGEGEAEAAPAEDEAKASSGDDASS